MRNYKFKWVLIVAIIAIYTLFVSILTKVNNPIISTNNDWIGYYGYIMGGILTLLGVKMTIDYSREQSKMDTINKVVPTFKMTAFASTESERKYDYLGNISNQLYNGEKICAGISLELQNIGLGNAYNFKFYFSSDNFKKDGPVWGLESVDKDSKANNTFTFDIEKPVIQGIHSINLAWRYEDMLGNEYEQISTVTLEAIEAPNGDATYTVSNINTSNANLKKIKM